ncbi:MAG: HEPN domain-containing protein [Bacteroidetes bacterium]|nr:MAG: HEPN domain-containing protein [Bacteroidota bacterium]
MASPKTPQAWLNVAASRGADADTLSKGKRWVGAIYMAGYAIECALKAYLHHRGINRPSGAEGHNLKALTKRTRLKYHNVIKEDAFFFDNWSVDLRYEEALPPHWKDVENRVNSAKRVVGRLKAIIKRQQKRRR